MQAKSKACADARLDEMKTCFTPPGSSVSGNSGHRKAHKLALDVQIKCDAIVEHKLALDVCYECPDYQARLQRVAAGWKATDLCAEQKDASTADCAQMVSKIAAAVEIRQSLDEFKKCFNGQLSKPRVERYAKASQNEVHCRDVLDYKKGKGLCK